MTTIELLEKQYQSFINQKRDWNFFLGLADYVKFINETPELHLLLEKTKECKLKQIETINKLEKEAIAELLKTKKEILKKIRNNKITKQGLPEALLKLEDFENGKIYPNHYKSSRLDEGLKNLIKILSDSEEDFNKNYPRYGLSAKLLKRMIKSSELHKKKETELWGAYEKIQFVFKIIHSGEKYLYTLEKDPDRYDEYLGFIKEMETIKNDGERPFLSLLPSPKKEENRFFDYREKEFKKDNYNLYATRIHNYLIQKLGLKQKTKIKKFNKKILKDKTKIDINTKIDAKTKYINRVLYFRNKEIDFRNKPNQQELLATLFKEPTKNWFYDEIYEEWGETDIIKNGWKKLYTAGNSINKAVAIETGVKDFIIKNTKQIQINSNYVS
ncbi:MAG: hypothetical protein ABIC82_00550 [bacterium]